MMSAPGLKPRPNYRGLNIPFVSFGAVTSDDLFSEKEQKIFDFYERSRNRYGADRTTRALDIGANIGVHSLLMLKNGWKVMAYEPDPIHAEWLRIALMPNEGDWIIRQCAVSDHEGFETFVRVVGNTTGSHLKGDKEPYGELQEIEVVVADCRPLFEWADFAKIDCEGHEARLLKTVTRDVDCEFMVEVGTPENAKSIFEHFHDWRGMWTQKSGWGLIKSVEEMPTHHSHGALFIGDKAP